MRSRILIVIFMFGIFGVTNYGEREREREREIITIKHAQPKKKKG
jgi:hypothetical protein